MVVFRATCAAMAIAIVFWAKPPLPVHAQEKRSYPLTARTTPRFSSRKKFSEWLTSFLFTPSQPLSGRRYLARPVLRFHDTLRLGRITSSLAATYEHQEFRFDPFERKAGTFANERVSIRPSPVPEMRYRYIRFGVTIRAPLVNTVIAELSMTSALVLSVGSRLGGQTNLSSCQAAELSLGLSLNYLLSATSELWGAMFLQENIWASPTLLDPSIADIALQRSLTGSAGINWKLD